MVQILTVTNGTTLLRSGIAALHDDGYRMTIYNVASVRDLRYAAPDLLIIATDSPRVIGASWDVFAMLPVALLAHIILLPASENAGALQDATRMFVPTLVRARRSALHGHAVA